MPKKSNDLRPYERYPIYKRLLERRDETTPISITELQTSFTIETGMAMTRKMVTRDMDNMAISFGLVEVDGHPKRYYIDSNFSQKYRLDLSEPELQILVLALEHMQASSLKVFKDHCQQLENVIDKSLPAPMQAQLTEFKSHYSFSYGTYGKPNPRDENSMKLILQAMRQGKTIRCKNISPYKDDNYNQRIRHFAPIQLSMAGNTPYLLVRDMDKDNEELRRPCALRLMNVEVTDQNIPVIKTRPIKLSEYSFGGFGGVKSEELLSINIKCQGHLATFLQERIIHPSQRIIELEKNTYLISLIIPYSSELPRFLSGYSNDILEITPNSIWNDIESFWSKNYKDSVA